MSGYVHEDKQLDDREFRVLLRTMVGLPGTLVVRGTEKQGTLTSVGLSDDAVWLRTSDGVVERFPMWEVAEFRPRICNPQVRRLRHIDRIIGTAKVR